MNPLIKRGPMPFIKRGIAFNRKGRVQPFVLTPYHPPFLIRGGDIKGLGVDRGRD